MSDYRNHSMNSLRSNSISCRFACLAHATQESKKIPIIVHPLKTSSCGMFSRSNRDEETWSTKCGNRAMLAWLVQALQLCWLATNGTQVTTLSLGSSKNVFEELPRRQAFSVVGVKSMANPERKRRAKAREPYQNFDGESLLSESIASSPYRGEALEGVDASLLLSSRRRK